MAAVVLRNGDSRYILKVTKLESAYGLNSMFG